MFGNCNHCCFCCGHPCTMLGVSLFISCKNKIQCVCVEKKKKQEKSQINNRTLHLKQLEKEEQKTLKVSRRKEIIKIRSETNEKEMKKTIAEINKTKAGSLRR